ncbi:peptide chain release factor N(5)-glutamine methyltransferase [Candidatus Saccharibacteria bacterium]|nr:peptide chain release factor N(5)-glutamine methyltransferase [Candidatus Saccharibacteria bacterium]
MTIAQWISNATERLRDRGIVSARLDAELILAHVLGKSREWLIAHGDSELDDEILRSAQDDMKRRLQHEPLAYILGHKEFYGRQFIVTPDVLIPRPETEQIVEVVKKLRQEVFSQSVGTLQVCSEKAAQSMTIDARRQRCSICDDRLNSCRASRSNPGEFRVLDVGTGSGAIAITLALELPDAQITASDISEKALNVAKRNAKALNAKVEFIKSDLFQNIDQQQFDIVVANLPYVAREWETSPSVAYEPEIALFAKDDGLELIKKLIAQAPRDLYENGFLVLELDPRQIETVKKIALKANFEIVDEQPFTLTLRLRSRPKAR